MNSIGERIHLLRLSIGWSVEECAYRMTIEANTCTDPELWLAWERCSDEQAQSNGLIEHLQAVTNILAADLSWVLGLSECSTVDTIQIREVIKPPMSAANDP